MMTRFPLIAQKTRKINGSFAWIAHRFLKDGFWGSLDQHELLLYFFLVLAADRNGLSFYSYDKICSLLRITLDEYIPARDGLIEKDLIAFDGHLFQVLSLPSHPVIPQTQLLKTHEDMAAKDPATISRLIRDSLNREEQKG